MLLDYKSMNELIRYSALYVVNPALYNVFTKDIKDVISGRCRGHLYHLEKDGDVIIARVYRAYRGKIPPGLGKKYDMLIVGKIGNRIVYWAPVDLGALQRGAVVAEASETP